MVFLESRKRRSETRNNFFTAIGNLLERGFQLTRLIPYPVGHELRGKSAKDTQYLSTLMRRTDKSLMPHHPRHHGVTMQAHHVISAKAVVLAGPSIGDRLEDFGYNINIPGNLVFIPSTLQGACLLQVQPHRGNHTATDAPDIDNNRDPSYHEGVSQRISRLMDVLEEKCGDPGVDVKELVENELNKVSRVIINLIQRKPSQAKLTKLFANFQPGNPKGCGGAKKSVNDISAPICPVHRNHTGRWAPGQENENITYQFKETYQLIAGQ